MSYNAGAIEATADLDRTPFQQGLRLLKQEARDFQKNKVTATADLDTKKADADIVDLRTRLRKLSSERTSVQVALDQGKATRGLIDLNTRLDALRAKVATAKADVDDQAAKDKLTALDIQLRRVGSITSKPRVSLEGVERANLQLDALELRLAAAGRGGGGGRLGGGGPGFLGGLAGHAPSGMALGIGAALPLAPVLGGLAAGAGASLLTPTVAGGLGLGLFGAATKSSLTTITKDIKTLTTLQKQYNAASTDKQRAAVLVKEHALWKSLDPAQRQAIHNVQGLEKSWGRFKEQLQPQSFGAIAGGAGIAHTLLHDLLPATKAVGDEVVNLESRAQQAFEHPFWRHFFGIFLRTEAPLAVHTLGVAVGDVGQGLARLTEKFAPLGHDAESLMTRWAGRFDSWTKGAGPGKFVKWVEKEGPIASKALGGIVNAIAGVGKGIAPIGEVELKALTPVLNFIGKLGDEHPAVITAIGTALLGVGAGLKVIAGVKGLQSILGGVGRLGRGGGVGGIVSKAAPVPVYVTNWEGGGFPGGGGKEPVPVGGKKPGFLSRLSRVLPAPAVLAGAYIATSGGDQAPGQNGLTSSEGIAGAHSPANAAAAKLAALLGNQAGKAIGHDGALTILDTAKAVGILEQGTKAQRQAVDDLAKSYPNVAHALSSYKAQQHASAAEQAGLNKLLLVNPGLAKNVAAANALVGASFARVTATLAKLGPRYLAQARLLGGDLGQGLIQGINAQIPHATEAGKVLVSQTVKSMRLAAQAHSPSRETMRLGKDLADGLVIGFTGRMAAVRGQFVTATGGVLATLAGIVAQAQQDAHNNVAGARSRLASDLASRGSAVSGIASSLYGAADIGGAYVNGGVGNISGYLRNFARADKRLLRDERQLRRRHLSGDFLEQIANAGPIGGVALAESILSGRSGSISGLNRLDREIHDYSRGTGRTVSGAMYDTRIAGDQQDLRRAVASLHRVEHLISELRAAIKANPHDFAAALDAVMKGAVLKSQAHS